MFRHLKRALASNLQTVRVQPREADKLASQGIDHAVLHRYLVWRRSVCLFIFMVTTASAVMNTANDTLTTGMPLHRIKLHLDALPDLELPELTLAESRFAELANDMMGVLLYALPVSAFGAAWAWKDWRRSRRLLLAGWLVGFLVPLILAMTPLSWWEAEPGNPAVDLMVGVVYGLTWIVLLLPTVLSLLPGMVQACLRIKTLLPESIIAGWILVAAAPFYSTLLLIIWVSICHVATNYLLLGGLLLWIMAPLVYVVYARVLTRPLITADEQNRFERVQLLASLISYAAMILLLIFVFTANILGVPLVGTQAPAIIGPWVVLQYALEYWGRALFITAVAADFFMRVNHSIWMTSSRFADSPAAQEYEKLMEQVREVD